MRSLSSLAVEFSAPYKISISRRQLREISEGEVLVRTIYSGISAGTEMLAYRGLLPKTTSLDETIEGMQEPATYPFFYGYCLVGEVVEVHRNDSPDLLGKKVFAFQPHQSYVVDSVENLILLPEGMEPECAVFLANMETAISYIMDGRPSIGERILVTGLGVVGLLLSYVLQKLPLQELTLVDPDNKRRSLVPANRNTQVIDPEQLGPAGRGDYDLIYETSGHPDALNTAIGQIGYAGRIIVGSWYGTKDVRLDLGSHFHRSKAFIYASQVSQISPFLLGRWDKKRRLHVALRMLEQLRPTNLITHQYHITNAAKAYRQIDSGCESLQVLLTYQ